jgi:acyl carrier protein
MHATQKIFALISEAASLPENFDLTAQTPIREVPGWDSFAWISIITGIEQYCGSDFPIDRVDELHMVGDLISITQGILLSQEANRGSK